ncbi:hypothetical protein AQV86_00070 [Nanohaloarchaea archaeon SG9]|nr:hypothetical protein AQV86_00070 [Nanohaloarchaea archaeon SG9]
MDFPGKNFSREDLNIFALGTALVLVLTFLVNFLGLETASVYVIDVIPVLLVLGTVYYSLNTQEFLGGEIGRNMSVIAVGLAVYGLTFHMINLPYQVLGHPTTIGLSSSFWLTLTNSLQIFGVSTTAIGFYLMWRESQ